MMVTVRGGNKLVDKLRVLAEHIGSAKAVRIGFLSGSTYPDGTSVPMVAAIQEYGAPSRGIPARPFFRNMIATKKAEWPKAISSALQDNGMDALTALHKVGRGIKGQLQQSIVDTNSPALSPVTVMLRGMKSHDQSLVVTGKTVGEAARRVAQGKTNYGASTKPLIENGNMLNSVDYEVKL
jgi:hypothetical protein